jgi:hypothetical protein
MINTNDVYRLLFGRSGTSKGSDIDMAEHGRTGGVDRGNAFKFVQEISDIGAIDEVDVDNTYIGYVEDGRKSDTDQAIWRILKIETSGTVTTFKDADGEKKFNKIWDDRASYTYS